MRAVKIGYEAARSLVRYLRMRARHPLAHRPELWLGASNRGPLTASGIFQVITRRGAQCGVQVYPHRFRHHFSHTWRAAGRKATRWSSTAGPPRRCSAATAPAPAAPAHAAPTIASWKTPDQSWPATARGGNLPP